MCLQTSSYHLYFNINKKSRVHQPFSAYEAPLGSKSTA